ncbi:MAG: thiamine phosphate synthase [Candidatus Brocadiia bacterium]
MKTKADYSLYLVAVPQYCAGRPVEDVVSAAVDGGVTLVQLRDKECTTREYVDLALRLKALLRPHGLPLIVNDRVDVALAVDAEGVHLGQADMPPALARDLMGPEAIIGLSVDSHEQAMEAETLDVDYMGVGPVYSTSTKADTAPEWGPEGLETFRPESRHVLVGIGGIDAENAADVMRAGADGVAVVSAICGADDPRRAASELRRAVEAGRRRR